MRSGFIFRRFFFEQINSIEEWNNRETLSKKPNGEYLQAGFDQISSDYGYFYSLYSLSKGDLTKYKEILNETVVNVYRTSQLQSRINESERIYSDLKSRKR